MAGPVTTDPNPALNPPPPVWLGNVRLDPVTLQQTLQLVEAWVVAGGFHLIVTPNVDHIIHMQRDPEFRTIYQHKAALVLADGQPVMWAARYLGCHVPEKVSGSDLLPALCARGAGLGWRVFFAGGHNLPELEDWLTIIRDRFPGLVLDGASPPFGFEHDPAADSALLGAINAFKPQLLCLALGTPKSELWLARHAAQLEGVVAMSIGAGLRMLAGMEPRAPRWMQRAGLEWLWRLGRDPVRLWKRYLVDDLKFFPLVWQWKRNPPR